MSRSRALSSLILSWEKAFLKPEGADAIRYLKLGRQDEGSKSVHQGAHLLEPVAVGSDEFEDTAAEFAGSVQIVSRLPDQFLNTKVGM